MKLRKLNKNNYAVSHQLVNIISIPLFIIVVLVVIINSAPLSPDTTVYSLTMDKKSMALQTASMLTDTPGEAADGSSCWEELTDDGTDTGTLLKPRSIGFRMNPYDYESSTSTDLRILSLKKINALNDLITEYTYDTVKTDILRLPNYVDFFIYIDFIEPTISDIEIPNGFSLENSKILITKSVNVLVCDPDTTFSYDYATLQVKIS